MDKKVINAAIGVVGIAILIGTFLFAMRFLSKIEREKSGAYISSFEECVKAGYPVMESYPRQCAVPDGDIFVEEIEDDKKLDDSEIVSVANPASTFCIENGGKLEIRDDATGQSGYCIFDDGTECEEWEYYRGECMDGSDKVAE
jgi:putative hemolysin